jgi:hypothetical protein
MNERSSAIPEKLLAFEQSVQSLTHGYDGRLVHLAFLIARVAVECREKPTGIDFSCLDGLRRYLRDAEQLGDWVRQVGRAFQVADGEEWLFKLLAPRDPLIVDPTLIVDTQSALKKYAQSQRDKLTKEITERQKKIADAYKQLNWDKLPEDTQLFASEATINDVLLNPEHRKTIEEMAKRYNVPPDLLAGIVAAEKDFDYDDDDRKQDNAAGKGMKVKEGPGIASVGDETLKKSINHLREHKLPGYEDAEKYKVGDVKKRVSFEGSVEAAAIVAAALVHYKGGAATATDKAVVWGAFRTGVKDFSPKPKDNKYGYNSQEDFRNNKANGSDPLPKDLQIGGNAYQSQPYFEFFEKAFYIEQTIDKNNIEVESHPFVSENWA